MSENLLKRIVTDPEVMAGKPVIRGTRIPVDLIVCLFGEKMAVKEILEDYPHLSEEDIRAALLYSSKVVEGEDVFPMKAKADMLNFWLMRALGQRLPPLSPRIVIPSSTIGELMKGAKDRRVLKQALEEKRILITNDKDFGEIVYRKEKPHVE